MAIATTAEFREYLQQLRLYGRQLVTITGGPGGGTFTLTYEGVATAAIAYNATATAVQTAIAALTGVGSANVKVTGPAGGPWAVSFTEQSGVGPLALGTNSLTGGTSPSVTVDLLSDDEARTILDRAESIVTEYLGFTFTDYDDPATERVIIAYGTSTLILPPHELGSVDIVTLQGSTTEITDWTEDPVTGNLTFDGWLPFGSNIYGQAWGAFSPFGYWGPGRYEVTAAWGYGTPPAALVEVVLELAVNIWRGRDRGMWSDIVGVEGSGGLRFTGGITNQQRAILDSIREKYSPGVAI